MDEETLWLILLVTGSILLSVGPWIASLIGGHFYQKSKKKKLFQRELNSARDPISNLKTPTKNQSITSSKLIWSNVVMSPSWFQLMVGGIHSIFGGRITTYTRTFDWARREVLQRLRETAWDEGFDDVINLRIETSMIAKGNNKQAAMEIVAYGTGIKY